MKEIEILVKVNNTIQESLGVLEKFKFLGKKQTLDIYYYDEFRDNLKLKDDKFPVEWFRVRQKGDSNFITYKKDNFENDKWIYSDEYETEVKDFDMIKIIVDNLGLRELVKINNVKYLYEFENYEIVLEEVEGLGLFLEVEIMNLEDDVNILDVKEKIYDFMKDLNLDISEELNQGKPEMMLEKRLNI